MEDPQVETTVYSLQDAPPARPEPTGDDRREGERHMTLFRVGSIKVSGRRELCLIKNISAGGMMIRLYSDLEQGARLSVELKSGHPVEGSVSWVKGNNAGVEFDEKIDVVGLLATSEDGPRPRMPRVEIDAPVTLYVDGTPYRAYANDISQGGVKVALDTNLPIDCDVVVNLPGLAPEAGVVRWTRRGEAGIVFNRLMPLSGLVTWLQEQRDGMRKTG